jgi:hypothetical protein
MVKKMASYSWWTFAASQSSPAAIAKCILIFLSLFFLHRGQGEIIQTATDAFFEPEELLASTSQVLGAWCSPVTNDAFNCFCEVVRRETPGWATWCARSVDLWESRSSPGSKRSTDMLGQPQKGLSTVWGQRSRELRRSSHAEISGVMSRSHCGWGKCRGAPLPALFPLVPGAFGDLLQ